MIDSFVIWFGVYPTQLSTILLSALPITELRLTIPVAINIWHLSALEAFIYAVIGNLLPFFPLFFGLRVARSHAVKHWPWLMRVIDSQLDRAQKRVEKNYARYGAFGLFIFTAIPLPFTGLWTATLAAVALKIPFKYATWGIGLGVIVAGIIVAVISLSARTIF